MTAVSKLLVCCGSKQEPPSEKGGTMTISELESMFEDLRKTNPRRAAEAAFALVYRYHEGGDAENARKFARECVSIFERLKAEGELKTLEDCTAHYRTLGGVVIPTIIHEDIARSHFDHWGVKL